MAIEKRDIDAFIEYIRQDPALRQRVLLALMPDDFLALPASVARLVEAVETLTRTVQELTQRVINLERIVAQHEERLARLEEVVRQNSEMIRQHAERIDMLQQELREMREHFDARISALEERMDRLEARFDQFEGWVEKRFRRLENQVGSLLGWQLEERYRTHVYAFFGQLLKDVQPVDYNSIDSALRRSLSDDEIRYLTRADLLLRGYLRQRPDEEVYLTLEVSSVVDMGDVERSLRRARLLEKAGLRAIPAVGGHHITADAHQLAQERNVVVALDGNLSTEEVYPED
ncbi:MAG: hypothetical protein C4335_04690 [Armatimonadota bacterium]